MTTYALIKTYPDGQIRRCHVTTDNLADYVRRELTAIIFPFATVEVAAVCDNVFTCEHHLLAPGNGAIYTRDQFAAQDLIRELTVIVAVIGEV